MAVVWAGATPVEGTTVTAFELGTRLLINRPCRITHIRIWNPGEVSHASRNGKIWTTNSTWTGQVQTSNVPLPDTMPAGWSLWALPEPDQVTTVPANRVVSYDEGPAGAGNQDFGTVASAFTAAYNSAYETITVPATGGVDYTGADGYPAFAVTTFYGIDVVFTPLGSIKRPLLHLMRR